MKRPERTLAINVERLAAALSMPISELFRLVERT